MRMMTKWAAGIVEVWIHRQASKGDPVGVIAKHLTTSEELRRGFMYQMRVRAREGMLFDFGSRDVHRMWMENVLVSLDMIFLDGPSRDDLKIVGILPRVEPLTTSVRQIEGPSTHVLEVAGGFCEDYGIRVGDKVVVPSRENPHG